MQTATLGFGFKVGHWTDADAATGCTVIIPPRGNVAACEIRGSSPGSREIAQLDNDRRLTEIHGLLLTGGSAFGLAAAHGVVEWLEERGIGYETPIATVPIVPAAVVFDLGVGRSDVRPGPENGRAACEAATDGPVAVGRVGAGTGATVGKWAGREHSAPGGVG
ncbi:MAG: P1 family peptidase, partial [Actinomycetota bacterium]|nr:P1 family peptidase [Actinomycetota bacterium]